MDSFFKLKENKTNIRTEVLAGITTFFAMSYIVVVNPGILSEAGMGWGAVYLATIISAVVGTLIMGLYANVPYAQAAGMGLNAYFTYTVVFALGFTWEEALSMVFLCGVINIIITVTKIRKAIIKAIPESIQHAISGGIGLFIAYIGLKNAGLFNFTSNPGSYIQLESGTVITDSTAIPALANFNNPGILLASLGILITIILIVAKVKGALLISIIITTLIGIPMGITKLGGGSAAVGLGESIDQLGDTFGVIFTSRGIPSLFSDSAKILPALMAIFSFSLTDTFDTIGTFIGTGRRSGIFSDADMKAMEGSGVNSKMDRALISDSVATSIGAIFGTSNTTTYVESAAGIGAGGRTGLTSVVTAFMFLLCIPLIPLASAVPAQATAATLVIVGVMMAASFKDIDWTEITEAIPAFFTAVFMGFFYSISVGIAFGFITYLLVLIVKRITGQKTAERPSPILIGATLLFIIEFVLKALF